MIYKQMPDVLCPNCVEKGGLFIDTTYEARPSAGYSLAGGQLKFSAVLVPRLQCNQCGWCVTGRWDGPNHAVFPDPHA